MPSGTVTSATKAALFVQTALGAGVEVDGASVGAETGGTDSVGEGAAAETTIIDMVAGVYASLFGLNAWTVSVCVPSVAFHV